MLFTYSFFIANCSCDIDIIVSLTFLNMTKNNLSFLSPVEYLFPLICFFFYLPVQVSVISNTGFPQMSDDPCPSTHSTEWNIKNL